jgi:Zn-dependent M16 (insulinase) family peptidase
MKGAMSNPEDAFMHKLSENLFQKSQYRFNSGGEPSDIPDLTYAKLNEFHQTYYHPSNSTFFTYGDLDFTEHLRFVQTEVLGPNFKRNSDIQSELLLEDRLTSAIHKEENFMPDLMSPADKQSKLGLFFLLDFDPATDPYEAFCIRVMENVILEGPNAPFYKNIIEAGVAPSLCPGAGFDHTSRQATFTLGVEGVSTEELKVAEKALFDTLAEIGRDGIERSMFE